MKYLLLLISMFITTNAMGFYGESHKRSLGLVVGDQSGVSFHEYLADKRTFEVSAGASHSEGFLGLSHNWFLYNLKMLHNYVGLGSAIVYDDLEEQNRSNIELSINLGLSYFLPRQNLVASSQLTPSFSTNGSNRLGVELGLSFLF